MTIGEKIRKLRNHTGLTQRVLGELSGTSETTIKQYELGKRQPRIEQLKKIAKVFDFPLYLLLDDNFELENVELEMKRARPVNSYEMTEPPKPFTDPISQYNKDNSIYIDPNLQKLYEVAIEKAIRHEELTEKEKQVINGIPGQLRQKSDSYEDSYSFASSEEELNKLQKEHSIEPNKRQNYKIHKYDATVEITPEAMERLKEDAEAREILKKYESGERILESEYKKVIEYHNRMMERSKLLQDWLEWYESTYEPLNNEGRKKVAEYAETLAETDKYANSEEWFKGRPTKEEIDKAVAAYLNDDNPDDPHQK